MPTSRRERQRLIDERRYREKRPQVLQMLGGACSQCGAITSLEIDHVDPTQKLFDVSRKLKSMQPRKLKAELLKCQLLCAKCHDLKTTLERGQQPMHHGSLNMYTNGKCRCELCRKKHTDHHREWRRRTGRVTKVVPRTGLVHGTANAYSYYKCRCVECRAGQAKRLREYKSKKTQVYVNG